MGRRSRAHVATNPYPALHYHLGYRPAVAKAKWRKYPSGRWSYRIALTNIPIRNRASQKHPTKIRKNQSVSRSFGIAARNIENATKKERHITRRSTKKYVLTEG